MNKRSLVKAVAGRVRFEHLPSLLLCYKLSAAEPTYREVDLTLHCQPLKSRMTDNQHRAPVDGESLLPTDSEGKYNTPGNTRCTAVGRGTTFLDSSAIAFGSSLIEHEGTTEMRRRETLRDGHLVPVVRIYQPLRTTVMCRTDEDAFCRLRTTFMARFHSINRQ